MQASVIIPVYNAEHFVAHAVESALAQPQTGQVVLVEDGSTDGSLRVCRSLAGRHPLVQVERHPGGANCGVSASRNLGIQAARCEFTAFLDADDWYLPRRFDAAERIFASAPGVDGVYDSVATVFEDESIAHWYRMRGESELLGLRGAVEPEQLYEALVGGNNGFFCTDGIVVRTRFFERTGAFDTSLCMGEDTAMWVRMSVLGRLVAGSLSEPVAMRRIHASNTIYRNRGQNAVYAVRMARSLLAWAREQRLPLRRRVLLLNWLLNFQLNEPADRDGYLQRKAAELRFFASFAARHPLVLRSGHFWRVASASLGARKLSSWRRAGARPDQPSIVAAGTGSAAGSTEQRGARV